MCLKVAADMHSPRLSDDVRVDDIIVSSYDVPTDAPESDGTLQWDKTTIVVVEIQASGIRGIGYTYADTSVASLVHGKLGGIVRGCDVMDIPRAWQKMVHATRNLGRPGIVSMAISAVDIALWDLKARILKLPLVKLLGAVRDGIAVYGSGGFTSYSDEQLRNQFLTVGQFRDLDGEDESRQAAGERSSSRPMRPEGDRGPRCPFRGRERRL
jgi:L-alanine-DL-glutamate epimerase-like enolase superfamily enzyme